MAIKEIKSIRLSEDNHRRLIKLQGQIQAEQEETTSMDDVIDILVTFYEISKKKSKK
jgi:hypothetical protein